MCFINDTFAEKQTVKNVKRVIWQYYYSLNEMMCETFLKDIIMPDSVDYEKNKNIYICHNDVCTACRMRK